MHISPGDARNTKNSFRDSFDGSIVRGASATFRLKTTAISREWKLK